MISRRIGTGLRITTLFLATVVLGIDGSPAAQAAGAPSAGKTVTPSRKAAQPRAKATVKVVSVPISEECPADDAAANDGLRAFLDPDTGELRAPTPEEEAALSRAIARETSIRAQAAKEVSVGPNGELIYYLGEEGMVDMIAHTDADGKTVVSCVSHPETDKALARAAPKKSAAAKEEK